VRQTARRANKSWRFVRRLATSGISSGGKYSEDAVAGGEQLRWRLDNAIFANPSRPPVRASSPPTPTSGSV